MTVIGRPFGVGNPGGPGRIPNMLSRDKVKRLVSKFWELNETELLAQVVENREATLGEKLVAAIFIKALESGDAARAEYLLSRAIGKVKDEPEGEGTGTDLKALLGNLPPEDQKVFLELMGRAVARAQAS